MWDKGKLMLVTNNNKAYDRYKDQLEIVFVKDYEEVLIKTRDLVHSGYELLTHPQASSLKPNQTPYRSIFLYAQKPADSAAGIMLIEKCLEVYEHWQEIARTPKHYDPRVEEDFKIIDLSVVDSIMQRLG